MNSICVYKFNADNKSRPSKYNNIQAGMLLAIHLGMSNVTKRQIKIAALLVHKDAANEPCLAWVKTRSELTSTLTEFLEGAFSFAKQDTRAASLVAIDMVSDALYIDSLLKV